MRSPRIVSIPSASITECVNERKSTKQRLKHFLSSIPPLLRSCRVRCSEHASVCADKRNQFLCVEMGSLAPITVTLAPTISLRFLSESSHSANRNHRFRACSGFGLPRTQSVVTRNTPSQSRYRAIFLRRERSNSCSVFLRPQKPARCVLSEASKSRLTHPYSP